MPFRHVEKLEGEFAVPRRKPTEVGGKYAGGPNRSSSVWCYIISPLLVPVDKLGVVSPGAFVGRDQYTVLVGLAMVTIVKSFYVRARFVLYR